MLSDGDEKHKKKIDQVEKYLLQSSAPYNFNTGDPDNMPITKEMDLSFEKAIAAMEEAGFKNPKDLTVFEWNVRIDYMKESRKQSENN